MEVLIRPFRPGDLDALFVLDYRCYAAPYRFGYQQLLRTLQDRDVSAIVIEGEAQDELIGGLIVRSDRARKQVTVISLMVESDYRRLGLARGWRELRVHGRHAGCYADQPLGRGSDIDRNSRLLDRSVERCNG